jgi:hypothetical protein
MSTRVLGARLGAAALGNTLLLLSCGQWLPTPYPSPTPRVAPLPTPEPTRCLQPREWRPPAGKNSGDTRDLADVLLQIADSMRPIARNTDDMLATVRH